MKEIKSIKLKNRELENKPNIMTFHNGFTEYKDENNPYLISRRVQRAIMLKEFMTKGKYD